MKYQRIAKTNLDLVKKDNSFLDIFLHLAELKNTLRTGWMKYHNLDKRYGESVADHSFSMATLSYILAKELKLNLDYGKVLKMALFHELGEIYLGDLVSCKNRDLSWEEKEVKEKQALERFLVFLGDESKGELKDLYEEFEKNKSPEARFVKSMDQLEAAFQAWLYKKRNLVGESVLEFKEYALKVAKENEEVGLIKILENLDFS